MQSYTHFLPLNAKVSHPLLYFRIGVENKKGPWTVCGRPNRDTLGIKLFQPMIHFCVVTTSPPSVVVVDDRTPPLGDGTNFPKGHLLPKLCLPLSPIPIVDDTVVRVGEYNVAARNFIQRP